MSSNLVIPVVMEVQSGAEVSRHRFFDCECGLKPSIASLRCRLACLFFPEGTRDDSCYDLLETSSPLILPPHR